MHGASRSGSTRVTWSAGAGGCSAVRSTTASGRWGGRREAYSAAVGNAGSAVSDDGEARVGLSGKLDALVVARLLFRVALPGGTGQLGVDRGRGLGGLLRRDATRAGIRAQHLHVVRVEAQPLDQEVDEGGDIGGGNRAGRDQDRKEHTSE